VRMRWVVYLGMAMFAGAIGSALLAPTPAEAVAREIIELQQSVAQLIQGQQALQTSVTQNDAVERTLIQQALDTVGKLNGTMGSLQKSVQDMQANTGARLDSMTTQVQGVSDNLQDMLARLGKLNQQLTDAQNAIQGIDAKLAANAPPPATGPDTAGSPPPDTSGTAPVSPQPPSADLLYSNALRDLNSHHYDLSSNEFQDYLRYYPHSDLASNAQFYLGEIAYAQKQYRGAIADYSKVIDNYPESFKMAPAHLKKGLALLALGEKTSGIRELRAVVRRYPGTTEERIARAKLRELGVKA
jgi:tol-pal system protein YbgF